MSFLDPERWLAARPHLDEALALPPEQRPAWLAALEASQPLVAADVAALLAEHDTVSARGFPEDAVGLDPRDFRGEQAGTILGPYQLTEILGEGGMGVVWRAEQDRPIRRTVAVKLVSPGRDSRAVLARFDSERQALAILNHPNIARVFDAGVSASGRPYFVMEYVAGQPITTFADRRELSVTERLALFVQVCDAIQHAHQKGVLHRDLKPTNILVSDEEGRPTATIIDFGVAKAIGRHLTGETLHTEVGMLVGTPQYMSPEQAGLVEAEVDTRTDIYSLGLVLYELLAGAPPFDMKELRRRPVLEILRDIREAEPPRLTTRIRLQSDQARTEIARARRTNPKVLLRELRGDLEWITARALEKEPAHRYASVSELRADVGRYLRGEAVLAGPPSTLYRLRKLARRHRAAAVALAVVAVTITASAIISTLALVRTVRAEDRTRRQLVGTLVAQGMQKVDEADPFVGLLYLTRALELEADAHRVRAHRIRIGETLQRSPALVRVWRHAGPIGMLALSSRGLVATGSADGHVTVRELSTGASRGDLRFNGAVTAGEFSRDGTLLAVAAEDGQLRIWRPDAGAMMREFGHSAPLRSTAFSPVPGSVAAIGEDGRFFVWNVLTGAVWFEGRHEGRGTAVAFSHSGALLATAGADGVRVWHVPSGKAAGFFRHVSTVFSQIDVAFSQDDRWLATGGADFFVRLWEIGSDEPKATLRHDAVVNSIRFSDRSDLLVTTASDHTTRVWRVPEGTPASAPYVSASIVRTADISRYRMIASPTQGGTVDLWRMGGERVAALPHVGADIARFDASGRFLFTTGLDGIARLWDLAPAMPAPPAIATENLEFTWPLVSSSDRALLAVSSGASAERGAVRVFDAASLAPVTPLVRLETLYPGVGLSPDGTRLVTASAAGSRLWNVASGEPLTPVIPEEVPLQLADFSPDGTTVLVGSGPNVPGGVRLRRSADGAALTEFLRHTSPLVRLKFSPDGRRFATLTVAATENVRLWSAETGQLLWTGTHKDGAWTMAWAPDGESLITGGHDQQVLTWTASTGAARGLGLTMAGPLSALQISRDGRHLLAGTAGGDLRLTALPPDGSLPKVMPHRGFVYQSQFSPDGSMILTSAGDQTARLWDARTGEALTPRMQGRAISQGATFLAADRWAWTGVGVFIDELTDDDRPAARLFAAIESVVGRTLTDSGGDVQLQPAEIDARFAEINGRVDVPLPQASADYHRYAAAFATSSRLFEEAVAAFHELRVGEPLRWTDIVRLLGVYAGSGRWLEALTELQQHRSHWRAAPELLFFEAVALMRLGDHEGAVSHCRAALDATRGTQHPERAYWAARACLLTPRLADADRADIEARVDAAYERVFGTLGQADLRGLLRIREGRPQEAIGLFRQLAPSSTSRPAFLVRALAASHAGLRVEAAAQLSRADAIPRPAGLNYMTAFFEGEAEALREQVVASGAAPTASRAR